ncbi:hypothetical protein AB0N09_42655 [Streptomyces erythrochromogenes]|uniref:hypothetical protein n=1 Tax=Streptomyces erythrochromogenes TaxID=285574 RepID=UPI00343D52F0
MESGFTTPGQASHLPELPEEMWQAIRDCLPMEDWVNCTLVSGDFHDRFWGGVRVHTQSELDEALLRHGLRLIVIEGPHLTMAAPQVQGTPIIVGNDVSVSAGRVYVRDNVRVTASGAAHVHATGQGRVTAHGQAYVFADGQAEVTAHGDVEVNANDQAQVEAHDRVFVLASDRTRVTAHDEAVVNAGEEVRVVYA